MYEKTANDLKSYIKAGRPIIYIPHFDFAAVDGVIKSVFSGSGREVYEYSEAGAVEFGNPRKPPLQKIPGLEPDGGLVHFLQQMSGYIVKESIGHSDKQWCLVLKDIHNALKPEAGPERHKVVAMLKSLAGKSMIEKSGAEADQGPVNISIIMVCAEQVIPVELEKLITILDFPPPDEEDIKRIIVKFEGAILPGCKCKIPRIPEEKKDLRKSFVSALKGLSIFECKQILKVALPTDSGFSEASLEAVYEQKGQSIKKSGVLELEHISSKEVLNTVGGLEALKTYLRETKQVFNKSYAEKHKILPKGILIAGVPGCGKTLMAQAAAGELGVPLLKMEIGKLLGKYVGESEQNFDKALKTAEHAAPCVLFIDEFEKAFGGSGGGDGGGSDVMNRISGKFLSWLQDKTAPVYVVATANKLSGIIETKPELLRKGRFDEIFKVDLPDTKSREDIFKKRLKEHVFGRPLDDPQVLDLLKILAEKTEGFSGADIDSVVVNAFRKGGLEEGKTVTQGDFLKSIEATHPISQLMGEQIENLRKNFKKYHFRDANKEEA